MSDQLANHQQAPLTVKQIMSSDAMKKRLEELLKDRAGVFMTSLMQIVNSSSQIKACEPNSVINAAITAATLDLPLNNTLGFAYIVPYNNEATFQLGYKGFKQLALRTGLFKFLNATDVREGEIVVQDRLSGEIEFKWIDNHEEREKTKIVGYVSYFELTNGFRSTFFMSYAQVHAHAKKYSQSFRSNKKWVVDNSQWTTNFDGMAIKTVTKLNLSKSAPLSVELQKAIQADQSVVKQTDDGEFEYVDNQADEKASPEEQNAELRALLSEKIEAGLLKDDKKKGRYIEILETEEVSSYAKIKKELEELK